jgi:hypothetical protein
MHQSSNSSPHSTRYTFDQEHRLPVTFLPLLSTDALKGLDVFGGGDAASDAVRDTFELSQSPAGSEETWFSASYDLPDTRKMSTSTVSSESSGSPVKAVTIGWICEDGFRPIGLWD